MCVPICITICGVHIHGDISFSSIHLYIYIYCVSSFSSQKWVNLLLMLLMLFVREKKWMNSSTAYVCVCTHLSMCTFTSMFEGWGWIGVLLGGEMSGQRIVPFFLFMLLLFLSL